MISQAKATHLFGVNDHDVISHVLAGKVSRLVLPAQYARDLQGQSSGGLTSCVDQVPAALKMLAREGHTDCCCLECCSSTMR
jgi:hypothetical protein